MPAVRRTAVKPGRLVRKIGLPWGGLGLFVNVHYVQRLLDLAPDIDVMIAGETDAYGFRFCTELGIDVIENQPRDQRERRTWPIRSGAGRPIPAAKDPAYR